MGFQMPDIWECSKRTYLVEVASFVAENQLYVFEWLPSTEEKP